MTNVPYFCEGVLKIYKLSFRDRKSVLLVDFMEQGTTKKLKFTVTLQGN